ncbi:metallophosphoesterase [Siminovitchia sediminis]|uniref:Metallophosphoesterase n=1 Tax=Siminovitchia sediminis TaxID=1274353 RepID=A0ABW4KGQ4_9BACI
MMLMMLLILIGLVIYILWDNNRIVVRKENIVLDHLPEQLQGFSILQISDLHEKEFGKNNKRLIEQINSLEYDAIVFTGDMLDGAESDNYEYFYSLIEGIHNKELALFVYGNSDPPSYQTAPVFEKSEFIRGMEKRGVQFLETIETLEVDKAKIHFINFEWAIITNPEYIGRVNGTYRPSYHRHDKYLDYQGGLWDKTKNIEDIVSSDVTVALNHFPIAEPRVDYIQSDPNTEWRNFDLILSGHYHGGQIRLPFVGALYIPEPWYEPNSFYPPQDRVKGLWKYKTTFHYVSAGLGSSDAISFLEFRLFNPPEMNLLKLTR